MFDDPDPFYDRLTGRIPLCLATHDDRRAVIQVGSYASMDLFAWLARESAVKLGYLYPTMVEISTYLMLDVLEKESK